MLLQKNVFEKLEVPFIKKGEEVSNGDIVTITGDIKSRPNRFDVDKDQLIIKIRADVGERYIGLNQDSINILIDEFKSNDSKDWVGKKVKVLLVKRIIGGNKVIVAYLVGESWELDDYGAPTNPGVQEDNEEIPVIQTDEEHEIKLSDVPF